MLKRAQKQLNQGSAKLLVTTTEPTTGAVGTMDEHDLKQPFKLSNWEIFPGRLMLVDGEEQRRLEPKAMETLVLLAAHAGETVTREHLIGEIWRDTYGSDEVLSRIVSLLRGQLGDDSRKPIFIETIPKIGYRLIPQPLPLDEPAPRATAKQSRWRVPIMLAGGLALCVLAYFGVTQWLLPTGATAQTKTIAVLPFRDIGGDVKHRFFADGLTDEVIASLSRSPGLRLVARRSLENTSLSNSSDIDYYIEGTVRFSGDRVRVYTELASVPKGVVLWSKAYENVASDYLGTQRDISNSIATGLNAELGIDAVSSPRGNVNLEAYTYFLNGRFLLKLRGEQPLLASINAFSQALQIEPTFDGARLGLANAYVLLPSYSTRTEDGAFAGAAEQLGRLQDPNSAEANAIRGFIAYRQWRWHEAERFFKASLKLNPDIANTHVWYSQFLSSVGRIRAALEHAETAYKLDSTSAVANDRLAVAYMWVNEDQKALRLYNSGANLGFGDRLNPGYLDLMLRTHNIPAFQQAMRALHPGGKLEPLISRLDRLNDPDAHQELIDVTQRMIDEHVLRPRLEFGWWVILKDWPRAVATIEKYSGSKKYVDVEFLFARECDPYRDTEQFRNITRRIGLEAYWKESTPDFRLASASVE